MKALVLCAGRGTRLRPLTDRYPKALLPVAGRPLLGYTLPWLAAHGVRDIVINLHHLGEQIEEYVGDGCHLGVRVQFLWERDGPQGTAGAVRLADELLGDGDVLVVYGDLLVDMDLRALLQQHRETDADGTLLVHRRRGSNSIVRMAENRRIVEFLERPLVGGASDEDWVNSGVQVLGPAARELVRSTEVHDLPADVFQPYLGDLALFGYPLEGFRCAIDTPERLESAEAAVRAGRIGAISEG